MKKYAFAQQRPQRVEREPLYHLPEIAEKLGVEVSHLRGLMRAHGSPGAFALAKSSADGQGYYRLSDVREWLDFVHHMPHSLWKPACLENHAMKPQRISMSSVRKLHREHGGHWFDRDVRAAVRSKIPACAVNTPFGNFFVSMETDPSEVTRYTVRRQDLESGDIETIGEYHSHRAFNDARDAMWSYINQQHFAHRAPIDAAEDARELQEA